MWTVAGGCFRQKDLEAAIEQDLKEAGQYIVLMERARGAMCTPEEVVGLVAYKVRILAKAMRDRANSDKFQEFDEIMAKTTTAHCASSSAEKK